MVVADTNCTYLTTRATVDRQSPQPDSATAVGSPDQQCHEQVQDHRELCAPVAPTDPGHQTLLL
ncbi:hypothetical protein K7711_38390 [Nocardia sp. CA2R105]|uniref:hypothetical protein n=1 Tax=Nocardia coffeae TaxID=2873381 RepID=UPI001CA63AD1|nr:hypothetical protein [Nocardia coffeae]MBY8862394.1 hypothetical protein [Nocardia coffeae]